MKNNNKFITAALLVASALILSYIESVVSSGIIIPGIKLGFSNIAVVVALYVLNLKYAVTIGILKSFTSLLLFGRLSSLAYSLAGTLFSVTAMFILKKNKQLTLFSVSIGGSFFNIIGQLSVASLMLGSTETFKLFPLFGSLSVISGAIMYIPERSVLNIFTKRGNKHVE